MSPVIAFPRIFRVGIGPLQLGVVLVCLVTNLSAGLPMQRTMHWRTSTQTKYKGRKAHGCVHLHEHIMPPCAQLTFNEVVHLYLEVRV